MPAALVSAALQVAVFTAVPLAVYLATRRRAAGFARYVGLYAPERRTVLLATALALGMAVLLYLALQFAPLLRDVAAGPSTPAGRLRTMGLGAESLGILLVGALVQTSLSEEILFRGFFAKRLIERLGFAAGNAAQAVLFALPHLLLLAVAETHVTAAGAFALFAFPFALGWLLGSLNERLGNGSIVPSWWAHGLGNATAYAVLAFT